MLPIWAHALPGHVAFLTPAHGLAVPSVPFRCGHELLLASSSTRQ